MICPLNGIYIKSTFVIDFDASHVNVHFCSCMPLQMQTKVAHSSWKKTLQDEMQGL